jgi:hypothetical protein
MRFDRGAAALGAGGIVVVAIVLQLRQEVTVPARFFV